MVSDFSLHRFEEFGALSDGERNALTRIAEPPIRYGRMARIRAEGDKPVGFFLLLSGWVAASHTMPDGSRQILKIHLPGDALGAPSMCMVRTVEELQSLTDVTLSHISFERFGELFEEHPRIAAKFLLSAQLKRVALMDRLVSIGRTSAAQRIAAFVLDLMDRLALLGSVANNSFYMVLTQEQIADVVSLTPVHTNRALKSLGDEGMITRIGSQYTVPDRDALARFAARPTRERHIDPAWLPPAR